MYLEISSTLRLFLFNILQHFVKNPLTSSEEYATIIVENISTLKNKGGVFMTNSRYLMIKIAQSGFSLSFIANHLQISLLALDMKIHNQRAFLVYEMQILSDLLGLNNREKILIFFTKGVELYST